MELGERRIEPLPLSSTTHVKLIAPSCADFSVLRRQAGPRCPEYVRLGSRPGPTSRPILVLPWFLQPFTFPLELSHLLSDFSVLVALRPSWSCRGPFTVHLFPRAFPTRSRRPVAALLSVRIHSLVAAARPDPRSLCVLFLSSSAARSHGETQRARGPWRDARRSHRPVSALADAAMPAAAEEADNAGCRRGG